LIRGAYLVSTAPSVSTTPRRAERRGGYRSTHLAAAVQDASQANPDVLWVALGLPKQERWIASHRDRLKTPVILAIGAAIKFHNGKVVPSQRWASKAGLEWLWRLLHEPRTVWPRALVYGPQFMVLSLLDLMRHKRKTGH
jgi:exopolysaccharide biosynthesis WecB/TagA/CpsF family protein